MDSQDISQQRLLIKSGNDIYYQQRSSECKGKSNADGFRTSVYKHFESNMRFIVCRTPYPVFDVTVYIPIPVSIDKVLPKALAELIFCGSKRYPIPGYMDVLTSYNYCNGINFRTFNNHTCFHFSASTEDAAANILPVLLDCVLNPLLHDDHFVAKVYHHDELGEENGTLFENMVYDEFGMEDLALFCLDKIMHNPSSTLENCNNERTSKVAALTNKDIIDYHRRHYDANNITVLLTGAFSDNFEEEYLQTIPADIVQSRGCDSRQPIYYPLPENNYPRHETVKYPTYYTSTGFIAFGWHGPKYEDVETTFALEILAEYLAGTNSSPLHLCFFENRPLSSCSVSMNTFTSNLNSLNICFDNVPYEYHECAESIENNSNETSYDSVNSKNKNNCMEDSDIPHLFKENYFKNLLLDELQRIYDTRFDGDLHALENAVKLYSDNLVLRIEENAYNVLHSRIFSDIEVSHFSSDLHGTFCIGSQAKQFDILAELKKKPVDYWLDLLKKWLIDGTMYSVKAVTDLALKLKLEAKLKKREQMNKAKVDDGEAHARYIEDAIAATNAQIPEEIRKTIPVPDSSKSVSILHTQSLEVLDKAIGPISAVQTINADAGSVEMRIYIPLDDVPDHLRAYLILFQIMLFKSDIVLPNGVIYDANDKPLQEEKRIQQSECQSRMSELLNKSLSDEDLSPSMPQYSWSDNMFVINRRIPFKNYPIALRWIVQAIMFSDFNSDDILTQAQSLLDSIADVDQYIDDVLASVEFYFTDAQKPGELLSNGHHMSFLAQRSVLRGIIDTLKAGKSDVLIQRFRSIRNALINTTSGFMALALPFNEKAKTYVEMFRNEWQMCYKKYAESNKINESTSSALVKKSPFPMSYKIQFPKLTRPLLVHVPVQSLDQSKALFSYNLDIPLYPTGKRSFGEELSDLISLDYYALSVLSTLLNYTDGPLKIAYCEKDYAYDVPVYYLTWSRTLKLEIDGPIDLVEAVGEIKYALLDIHNNWDSYFGNSDLNVVRSTMQQHNASTQVTPLKMLDQSIENSIHGFSSAEEYNAWRNTHIGAVKMSDVRRVYKKYVLKFADYDYPMFRLLLTPSNEHISEELDSYKQITLEEIGTTYNRNY